MVFSSSATFDARVLSSSGLAVLFCLAVLAVGGCAEHGSTAHRVHPSSAEPGSNQTTETQAAAGEITPAETDASPQASTAVAGPISLEPARKSLEPTRPHQRTDTDRFAFLDWFGAAADRARAKNPAAELRKSRAVTAAMVPQSDTTAAPAASRPFAISDGSRLVPTFADGLPEPGEDVPRLRGGDATGPVTSRGGPGDLEPGETPKSPSTTHADDPARDEYLNIGRRLRQSEEDAPRAGNSADDHAVIVTGSVPPRGLPQKDNPVRIQISARHDSFDEKDLAALQQLAELHRETGRNIHIHGVSRGRAGDRDTGIERVRRLHRHADRAITALSRFGVNRSAITTSSAEQRMTGADIVDGDLVDHDRLEFSLQ